MSSSTGEFVLGQYRIGPFPLTQANLSERALSARWDSGSTSPRDKRWPLRPCKKRRSSSRPTSRESQERSASWRYSDTPISYNSMKYPHSHSDHRDQNWYSPHHGIRRGRIAVRLHRQEEKAGRKGSRLLHAANSIRSGIHPQERNRASRPQALKLAPRSQQEHQDRGFRPIEPVQTRRKAEDRLWVALLCRPWDDRRKAVLVLRGWYLVLRHHFVCHALRLPPLRRSQYQQIIQKDHGRIIRNAKNTVSRVEGSPQRNLKHQSVE